VQLANASGELYLEERRPATARRQFDEALRGATESSLPNSSPSQGTTRLGIAQTELLAGRPYSARSHAYSVLALASGHADIEQIVASLELLAAADHASNRRDVAVRTLRTAVDLLQRVPTEALDSERRAMYLATQHAAFADLTDLLVTEASAAGAREQSLWDAFAVAEEAHARSLRIALEQTATERGSSTDVARASGYRDLLRAIAALSPGDVPRSGLLERLDELAGPPLRSGVARDRLASKLHDLDATLVEYATGRDTLFAFVVDREQIHVVTLGNRLAIAQLASDLATELRAVDPAARNIRTAARRLAQRVLWPLVPYLVRQRVILVPDDALHTVPFVVLPWTEAPDSDLVLHRVEVSSIPSALLLARLPPPSSAVSRFALIGDPVFHRAEWVRSCPGAASDSTSMPAPQSTAFEWTRFLPNLPGSRAEVLGVSDLIRRTRTTARVETLLGCQATGGALREVAPGADVLHIATHGLVDARRPRLSALVLSPDSSSSRDAAFSLLDILDLRLTARLVVLSACDTSRGRLLPGEGVLGLAQAFLQAGSETVVASYWRVEDETTAPFMQRFYGHMLADRMSAAAALRRTQLDLAGNDASYRWAAFSVYGRPDSTL
jgi:CHAT domain-containing protein